jgi:hypothetical protein
MIYSVLGGIHRTVEVVPEDTDLPAYCMGTYHLIEYLKDAVFYKTFKLSDFLDHYRFSGFGERYLDPSK